MQVLLSVHAVPPERRHLPLPSHREPPTAVVQSTFVSPVMYDGSSAKRGTFEHVPFASELLHDLHSPVHASLQHTPSAQKPDSQPSGSVHAVPMAALHLPAPSQTPPAQGVPAPCGIDVLAPFEHEEIAHSAAGGTSVSSGTDWGLPSGVHSIF